jgi:endonuclease G
VSVIAGPILRNNDRAIDGVKVPRAFWKLIAYIDSADKAFKVRAYVLTQDDLLRDVEALDLDEFRLFQISIPNLEERTGLRFPDLRTADSIEAIVGPEGVVSGVREVTSRADVVK